MELLKSFWKEEEGLGTVEMVILIAVLVAVALIFGKQIKSIVSNMLRTVTNDADNSLNEIRGN